MRGGAPGAVRSRDDVATAMGITGPGKRNVVARIERRALDKLIRGMEERGWGREDIAAVIDEYEPRRSSIVE